jgi:exo-beta-1,3-glucanase (GH17 family)
MARRKSNNIWLYIFYLTVFLSIVYFIYKSYYAEGFETTKTKKLYGIVFSPVVPSWNEANIKPILMKANTVCRYVRIYNPNKLEVLLKIIKDNNLMIKVHAGFWTNVQYVKCGETVVPDDVMPQFDEFIRIIKIYGIKGIHSISMTNEAFFRTSRGTESDKTQFKTVKPKNNYTYSEYNIRKMIYYINTFKTKMKNEVPNIELPPIGITEAASFYTTQLKNLYNKKDLELLYKELDFVSANIHSKYTLGSSANADDYFNNTINTYNSVKDSVKNFPNIKSVMIGEVGLPTCCKFRRSDTKEFSIPLVLSFIKKLTKYCYDNKIRYFYFGGYDNPTPQTISGNSLCGVPKANPVLSDQGKTLGFFLSDNITQKFNLSQLVSYYK